MSPADFAVNFFVALFALIDPIGNVPLFAAATALVLAGSACGSDTKDDSASSSGGGDSMKLTIGYSAWPGWFPLAVAEKEGIFDKAGLDVDLKYFADYTASLDALVAGQVDVNAQTLNDTIFAVASGADQKVIVVNDNSTGNDQIICDSSVTSIADLKGKTVAAEAGVVDHFLLLQGLAKEGLTEKDIDFKGVKTDAAAAAFAGGEFDCVGVFAPFTVQAAERPGSKVLFSSKDFPGAIPDHLVATADAAKNTKAMAALVDAWYQTLETYSGKQESFHWRHLQSALSKDTMNLQCNFCHQSHDPREKSPHVTATKSDGGANSSWRDNAPAFTLRKSVNPAETCLRCHGGVREMAGLHLGERGRHHGGAVPQAVGRQDHPGQQKHQITTLFLISNWSLSRFRELQ